MHQTVPVLDGARCWPLVIARYRAGRNGPVYAGDCRADPLANAGWFGPAMAQFRMDPSVNPWLMEINECFWGSLQLATDCTVDFPCPLEILRRDDMSPFRHELREWFRALQ